MTRFRLYRLRRSGTLVLDVQADLLDELETRSVVPVLPLADFGHPIVRLNPQLDIGDQRYVMVTQFIAAIDVVEIGAEVADFRQDSDTIPAAIDFLFQGF